MSKPKASRVQKVSDFLNLMNGREITLFKKKNVRIDNNIYNWKEFFNENKTEKKKKSETEYCENEMRGDNGWRINMKNSQNNRDKCDKYF